MQNKVKVNEFRWLHELYNEHVMEPAFVIGNGLSVRNYDTSKMVGHGILIGCNLGFEKHPLDYVVWQDTTVSEKCVRFKGKKITTPAIQKKIVKRKWPKHDTFIITFGRRKQQFTITSSSTGQMALQIAVMMGCNPIFLVGCDGCAYEDEKGGIRSNIFRDKTNYGRGKRIQVVNGLKTVPHLMGFAKGFTSYCQDHPERDFYKMGKFGLVQIPAIDFPEFYSEKHPKWNQN
jgi:hypothetical protein